MSDRLFTIGIGTVTTEGLDSKQEAKSRSC